MINVNLMTLRHQPVLLIRSGIKIQHKNNDEPIAYIEAAIFGNEAHYGYDAFTAETTNLFANVLNIRPDHIYVKYEDIIAWGVQGMYIDRNQYR